MQDYTKPGKVLKNNAKRYMIKGNFARFKHMEMCGEKYAII